MKRVYVLLLAVLLTLSSLISTSAAAEQPDPWAADAMAFALEHHLLAPEEVAPKQPAARGQLAAITVRLLQLQQRADLSGYSDVTPSTLYYESLSKAVAIGLLEGNGGQLSPGPTSPGSRPSPFWLGALGCRTAIPAVWSATPTI